MSYELPIILSILVLFGLLNILATRVLLTYSKSLITYYLLSTTILVINLTILQNSYSNSNNPYELFLSIPVGSMANLNLRLDNFSFHMLNIFILLTGIAYTFLYNRWQALNITKQQQNLQSLLSQFTILQILIFTVDLLILAADLYSSLALLLFIIILLFSLSTKLYAHSFWLTEDYAIEEKIISPEKVNALYYHQTAMYQDLLGYSFQSKKVAWHFLPLQIWLIFLFLGVLLGIGLYTHLDIVTDLSLDYLLQSQIQKPAEQNYYVVLILLCISLPIIYMRHQHQHINVNLIDLILKLLFILLPISIICLRGIFFLTQINELSTQLTQILPCWKLLLAIIIVYYSISFWKIPTLNTEFIHRLMLLQLSCSLYIVWSLANNTTLKVAQNIFIGLVCNQLLLLSLLNNLHIATFTQQIRQPLLGFFHNRYSSVGLLLSLLATAGLPISFNIINSFMLLHQIPDSHSVFLPLWLLYAIIFIIKIVNIYRSSFYYSITKEIFQLQQQKIRENFWNNYTTLLPIIYLLIINLTVLIFNV